jgi:hypothetical protein
VIAGGIALAVVLVGNGVTTNASTSSDWESWWQGWGNGLFLRQLAALPHYVILFFLGIAVFVVWLIVQWVILFAAAYPKGMYDFSVGVVRWQLRVQVYALGLIDRYPPFSFDPSMGSQPAGSTAMGSQQAGSAAPTGQTSSPAPASAPQAPVVAPAQWYPDPSGRHQYRYWDGTVWTTRVADEGVESNDSL